MRSEIKTALIFGILIATALGVMSMVFSSLDLTPADNIRDENLSTMIDKSRFKTAPDLVGISHYLNTTPEELERRMDGKVILYDIWTYSCINCIRTLPYITAWDEKYANEGLLIIGVHSPEFEFEKDPKNVKMAVDKYEINYPVVLDNDMETWKAFENRYWPRKYIADYEGYIRYDHIGEGGYRETEKIIQLLLDERATSLGIEMASSALVDIESFEHSIFKTPELYFGYKFAQNRNQLGSQEGFRPESTVTYAEPARVEMDKFYLVGDWKNHHDSMELVSETGEIKMRYNAKQVNIVTENEAELVILLDGEAVVAKYLGDDLTADGKVSVSGPDLYNLISAKSSSSHLMEIQIRGSGFQIFTFTFG